MTVVLSPQAEHFVFACVCVGGATDGCIMLDQQVPDSSFRVADVARTVGKDVLIRPIHVGEQANIDKVRW